MQSDAASSSRHKQLFTMLNVLAAIKKCHVQKEQVPAAQPAPVHLPWPREPGTRDHRGPSGGGRSRAGHRQQLSTAPAPPEPFPGVQGFSTQRWKLCQGRAELGESPVCAAGRVPASLVTAGMHAECQEVVRVIFKLWRKLCKVDHAKVLFYF